MFQFCHWGALFVSYYQCNVNRTAFIEGNIAVFGFGKRAVIYFYAGIVSGEELNWHLLDTIF